jgi:PKD repeat protein
MRANGTGESVSRASRGPGAMVEAVGRAISPPNDLCVPGRRALPPRGRRFALAVLSATVAVLVLSSLLVPASASVPRTLGSDAAPPSPPAPSGGGASGVAAGSGSEILPMVPEPASVPSTCVNANAGDKYPVATTGYLELEGNLWNMTSNDTGGTSLCYDASTGVLSNHIDVDTPDGAFHHVIGFPEAVLGQSIYGGASGYQNPALPLPVTTVSNLTGEDLWSSVNYSMQIVGRTPYNLAYDDWLTLTPANGTVGRNPGDRIEVMLWFSTDLNRSWIRQEPVAIPSFVNGTVDPRDWLRDQWCENASQITFDYYYENTPNNLSGTTSADISVNMSAIFANVEQYIESNPNGTCFAPTGTDISNYYAANFPFGVEVYPNPHKTFLYEEEVNWSLSDWCYTIVAGAPTGAGTDCGTGTGGTAPPLNPAATAVPTTGEVPLAVNFTGTVSGGAGPLDYGWSFGSGLGGAHTPDTNYTYTSAGTYEANLTVVDYDDIATSSDVAIQVQPVPALAVTLTANPPKVIVGSPITLTANVSGGRTPFEYRWWGLPNGTGCASANTSTLNCTAATTGSWEVVVGVYDANGYGQGYANISVLPVGSFFVLLSASPSTASVGTVIKFTASVTGGAAPFEYRWWGFPSGPGCVSSNRSTVNCTAEASGTWEVVVGVNDASGYAQAETNVSIATGGSPPPSNSTSPSGGGGWNAGTMDIAIGAATVAVVGAVSAGLILWYRSRHSP